MTTVLVICAFAILVALKQVPTSSAASTPSSLLEASLPPHLLSLSRRPSKDKEQLQFPPALRRAVDFLHRVQNPPNCSTPHPQTGALGLHYAKVAIGINGGFAAQFQLAAGEFMQVLHASRFSYPVVVVGELKGYSRNEQCKHAQYEWLCYFEAPSACHKELLLRGKEVAFHWQYVPDEQVVPKEFEDQGIAFWWGAVQYYLFRVRPSVQQHILAESALMSQRRGFPFRLPTAGIHVRHGDKHVDGFLEHSLQEELQEVRRSPDCAVTNARSDCFFRLNMSRTDEASRLISKAIHGFVPALRPQDIERFNGSKGTLHPDNLALSVDPKTLLALLHKIHGSHRRSFENNSTARSLAVPSQSHHEQLLVPLHVFVASDDPAVVSSAQRLGFLTDTEGVSHSTSTNGMLNTLSSRPELGFNATLEVITDIFFLSQCSTLLGICASQVFRMAVALSNVTGVLHFTKALDMNQIARVQHLSRKYHVPFPENFV